MTSFPSIHDRQGPYFFDPDVEGDTVLYQQPELTRYRIRATDKEGKRVNLLKVMMAGFKPGEAIWAKGMQILIGTIFSINQGSNPIPHSDSVHQFEAGFLLGTLIERFRVNRGVKFEIETTKVTAEEFDAAFARVKEKSA